MTPKEFHQELMNIIDSDDLTDKEIAHAIGVSLLSVERWISGRNTPAPVLRPLVVQILKGLK